jgi:hypothetical protein
MAKSKTSSDDVSAKPKPAEEQSKPVAAPSVSFDTMKQLARTIVPYVESSLPYLKAGWDHSKRLYRDYWSAGYGEILYCFLLVFFGGQFALTILAIQAFNQTGGVIIEASMHELKSNYEQGMRKLQDEPGAKQFFDRDGDGIVTSEEVLLALKDVISSDDPKIKANGILMTSICMKCVDPHKLVEAIVGLWAGLIAVIATLKSTLAKNVSNGAKIGEHLLSYIRVYLEKPLYEYFPEHKSWVDVGLQAGCALTGIVISLMVVRVVSAFNSALNGAHRLAEIAMGQLRARGLLKDPVQESTLSQAIVILLVFMGINWQLSTGFSLPWYLRPVLLPLSVFESITTLVAAF